LHRQRICDKEVEGNLMKNVLILDLLKCI